MAVPDGAHEATSFYETKLLKSTLKRLVDFERINTGAMRFRADAASVRTGDCVYFDNTIHATGPEYAMASDLLPPGFPAGKIEGEYYWDGGLSRTCRCKWPP
ncbi:patatin-like phospholipase family protein [Microvirga sp. G4-2]|uniref:patatin-like phospholipase family protein n=1 Tax=Microvirga sp. G4-2 TaxID=3434467 RepID=UPI004044A987